MSTRWPSGVDRSCRPRLATAAAISSRAWGWSSRGRFRAAAAACRVWSSGVAPIPPQLKTTSSVARLARNARSSAARSSGRNCAHDRPWSRARKVSMTCARCRSARRPERISSPITYSPNRVTRFSQDDHCRRAHPAAKPLNCRVFTALPGALPGRCHRLPANFQRCYVLLQTAHCRHSMAQRDSRNANCRANSRPHRVARHGAVYIAPGAVDGATRERNGNECERL